nr:MAG TPA: Head decoration protein [Caudoviricetes sp.]
MSQILNNKGTDISYDNLIYSSKHPIDVKVISVSQGLGVLKRGTVMSLVKETGAYVVCGNTVEGKTVVANCIIADEVDTGTTGSNTVGAVAYITGNYNKNCLIVKDSYSLTEADIENLRSSGIIVSAANK